MADIENIVDINEDVEETVEEVVEETTFGPDEKLIEVVKDGEDYFVIDIETNVMEPATIIEEGKTIKLPKNRANRQYITVAKFNELMEKFGKVELTYKATRHIGTGTGVTRMPNEKLISYLPEELQEEYKAIIARAKEAMLADKKKPMTEAEKLAKKIEKAKDKILELMRKAKEEGISIEDIINDETLDNLG